MTDDSFWDKKIETLPHELLQQVQLGRLQWQVRRCWEGSEFYRERLGSVGLEPDDIRNLDDLRRMPILTRRELREELLAHPPFGRYAVAPAASWRELHTALDQNGASFGAIWSEADLENSTGLAARAMWSMGVRAGDIVQNGLPPAAGPAGAALGYGARRIGCMTVPAATGPAASQIEHLRQYGASTLLAADTGLRDILEALRRPGSSPTEQLLRVGLFASETGSLCSPLRSEVERSLAVDAFAFFGPLEIGPCCAAECRARSGLHWAEDHYIVEVLDRATREPLPDGEAGILVVTHLSREATPLLRFWTGDDARLISEPELCECGRTHKRSLGLG